MEDEPWEIMILKNKISYTARSEWTGTYNRFPWRFDNAGKFGDGA